MFLLLFGAVRIKWIALVLIVIDIISIPSSNAGGHIAHLGGALFGFAYVKMLQNGRDPASGFNRTADRVANILRGGSGLKVSYRKKEKSYSTPAKTSTTSSQQEKLDLVLDK